MRFISIMSDEYKDIPISIGEIRSIKPDATAKDWTPRDALVDVIRAIDNGLIDPSLLVVSYFDKKRDGTFYSVASELNYSRFLIVGFLQRIIHFLNTGDE